MTRDGKKPYTALLTPLTLTLRWREYESKSYSRPRPVDS